MMQTYLIFSDTSRTETTTFDICFGYGNCAQDIPRNLSQPRNTDENS